MEGNNRYYSNQTRNDLRRNEQSRQGDYYDARHNGDRDEGRSQQRSKKQEWTSNYPTSDAERADMGHATDEDFWQSRGSNYVSPSKWHDRDSRNYRMTPGYFNNYQSDYAGRGPKNYQRSDERIREDVCEALMHNPYVDASSIEVEVKDAVVTLKGTVAERRMKRMAEDCVEQASAVKDIRNELSVSVDSGEMLSPRAKTAFKKVVDDVGSVAQKENNK